MSSKLKAVAVTGGVVLAVVGVAMLALWPRIARRFDHERETVDVGKLAGGYRPATRNLTVVGMLVTEVAVEKMATDDQGRTKERRRYFPLVVPGWTPKDPVHVVFTARAWPGYRQEELARQPSQSGTVRNILWEGLSEEVKAEFAKLGVRVADDALLLDETYD
jgi:hypothetical protein